MIPRTWFIYVLKDPRDQAVRYVGISLKPRSRFGAHTSSKVHARERTHKTHWIEQLISLGLMPEMEVIDSGTGAWRDAERSWIKHYRDAGSNLTNATDGGEGSPGVVVRQETREKKRQQMKGRVFTEEWKRKISEAKKGVTSEAIKAAGTRNHSARRGTKQSPELIEKRIAALRGRKRSPETISKIAASNLGKKRTPEQRARMAAAHRGPRARTHEAQERLF